MRVDPHTPPPSPLDAILTLLCRQAADLLGAPWAAMALTRPARTLWHAAADACPTAALERAVAVAASALPPGVVQTAPLPGGLWMAATTIAGGGGRLLVFDSGPIALDAARQALLVETAGLAAARLSAGDVDPAGILDIARIGYFSLDRASGATTWSPDVYRLYGYDPRSRAPTLAMALAAFPAPALAELRRGIAQTWETGAEISVASSFTRTDGGRRDVLVRFRADDPGGPGLRRRLSGVLLDVTDARAFDERLDRERELLRTTLDHMDQGIYVVDADLSLPVLSRRATELLCLPDAFLDSRPSFPEILAYQLELGQMSRDLYESNSYMLRGEALPETDVSERQVVSGKILEVRTTSLPAGGYVRTFTDQTARRRREAEIARAHAEYRLLFENSVNGIYRTTPEGRVLRANPALARFSGYETEAEFIAAIGDARAEWCVDPADKDRLTALLRAEGRVEDYVYEVYRHRTRERVWISETAWVIRDAAGAIVAHEGTVIDATERKRTGDQIAHMARHDALTGLPNRIDFTEKLERALTACDAERPLAVLFFDLVRFKAVNDTLGHPAGDALLRVLAERIAALLGPGDVVARFGGDEFALLAPVGDAAAAALAERILAAVRAPVTLEGREITVGASIGVALAPRDGLDPTQLMKSADVALYRAKGEGRDTFRFFAQTMDAEGQDRQRLEIDLRHAIERGEFSLLYQPVVRIDGRGAPVGFEALLRWTHPERGPVPPQVFIAIAEETRMIGRIGAWVLARACADAALWPGEAGLWVNVSAVQLAQDDFETMLQSVLAETGFSPLRLVLEITETALMESRADLAPKLERLRASGVRTALDDFGTGYSSLGYLRRFVFDVIKIDQSFTQTLSEPATGAIVAAVLDLSGRLGMVSVAEGVETEAQLAALRAAGCALAQGHIFGPPVGAAEAARLGG